MADMQTSGDMSEFDRIFGHLSGETRLEQIIREGNERIDAAVERVIKTHEKCSFRFIGYEASRWLEGLGVPATIGFDRDPESDDWPDPGMWHARRFMSAVRYLEGKGETVHLGRVREVMRGR